jgi:hypothetical protein
MNKVSQGSFNCPNRLKFLFQILEFFLPVPKNWALYEFLVQGFKTSLRRIELFLVLEYSVFPVQINILDQVRILSFSLVP